MPRLSYYAQTIAGCSAKARLGIVDRRRSKWLSIFYFFKLTETEHPFTFPAQ